MGSAQSAQTPAEIAAAALAEETKRQQYIDYQNWVQQQQMQDMQDMQNYSYGYGMANELEQNKQEPYHYNESSYPDVLDQNYYPDLQPMQIPQPVQQYMEPENLNESMQYAYPSLEPMYNIPSYQQMPMLGQEHIQQYSAIPIETQQPPMQPMMSLEENILNRMDPDDRYVFTKYYLQNPIFSNKHKQHELERLSKMTNADISKFVRTFARMVQYKQNSAI